MSAQVTASLIKELRDRTGVGMSKCKEALEECGGDMDKAIEHLRKKGIAAAVKKESREAKEGVIVSFEGTDVVALVEVSAETDFVTQNQVFQTFIQDLAEQIAQTRPTDLDTLSASKWSKDPALSVDECRAVTIQQVGENVQIRRFALLPKKANTSTGIYSHMGGRIVTTVTIEGSSNESSFARDIAMHVAAARPDYLNPEDVPQEILAKEREIAQVQVASKPAQVQEKIVEGKVNAFYGESCLSRQKYVREDSKTVTEIVAQRGKEVGKPLALVAFTCWEVGQ